MVAAPSAQPPFRILVVDDHPLFREGVVHALQQEPTCVVVGEAGDGLEAIEKGKLLKPDVVLMDVNMPRCNGLEALLGLQSGAPGARVVMLTVSDKDEDLFTAIKFGARGYLLKDASPQEIVQSVAQAAAGEVVLAPAMAARLLQEFGAQAPPARARGEAGPALTPREMEVLSLLGGGASNREIAAALIISENTVKTHLKNILEKLHVKNRSQAAAYAARLGFTP